MNRISSTALLFATILLATGPAAGEPSSAEPTKPPADAPTDDLTAQDREVLAWANQAAGEASQTLEKWLASKAVTEDRLLARLYYPIADTDPIKYSTDYDALADRDFPATLEKSLAKSSAIVYVVIADINGYVPTHNQRYSQPLTGNPAVDLVNNRTKRIFGDRTGIAAARSDSPYLLQRYKRDTGETMADLSVPVYVRGKHFGCIRFGYRREER